MSAAHFFSGMAEKRGKGFHRGSTSTLHAMSRAETALVRQQHARRLRRDYAWRPLCIAPPNRTCCDVSLAVSAAARILSSAPLWLMVTRSVV